jgi:hypothetical protein
MKKKKYSITLSTKVQHQLMAMSEEDRKIVLDAFDKIAKDPTIGTPVAPDDPIRDLIGEYEEGMTGEA